MDIFPGRRHQRAGLAYGLRPNVVGLRFRRLIAAKFGHRPGLDSAERSPIDQPQRNDFVRGKLDEEGITQRIGASLVAELKIRVDPLIVTERTPRHTQVVDDRGPRRPAVKALAKRPRLFRRVRSDLFLRRSSLDQGNTGRAEKGSRRHNEYESRI